MANKKSIIDLLPAVGTDKDSSDFPFRFNRHAPGDYLDTEQQRELKDQENQEDLRQKLEKVEKPRQLIPPAGIPPPTAEEVLKLRKSQSNTSVDFCMPVEYQSEEQESHSEPLPDIHNIETLIEPQESRPQLSLQDSQQILFDVSEPNPAEEKVIALEETADSHHSVKDVQDATSSSY